MYRSPDQSLLVRNAGLGVCSFGWRGPFGSPDERHVGVREPEGTSRVMSERGKTKIDVPRTLEARA